MTHADPDESSNPDGSAGWDALPPDGEPQEDDDAGDRQRSDDEPEGDRPDRPRT